MEDRSRPGPTDGYVELILIRPTAAGPTQVVDNARLEAGRGLVGDRYWNGRGTFWKAGKVGQDVTLIENEALEALARETGIDLSATDAGRNLVTRGVRLNELVGRRFRVGPAECVGRRLCEPCTTLARRTEGGVLAGLAGRGGLRADVLISGEISTGAEVVDLGPAPPPTPPPRADDIAMGRAFD